MSVWRWLRAMDGVDWGAAVVALGALAWVVWTSWDVVYG